MKTGVRALASVLAAGMIGASAMHAPQAFATIDELFAVQERLNATADRIVAARGDGYAGVIAAPENRHLRVYWKGEVPAEVRQIADQADVPVRFLPAEFTERQLMAEARRLAADPGVRSVGPRADGSGLTVDGQPWDLMDGRQDDDSPYRGGSKYTVGRSMCSSGFAIEWNGEARMLSAGHCGNDLDVVHSGDGSPVGDVINDNDGRDTLMFNTRIEGETFEGRVFTGPFTSDTGVDVVDVSPDYVGNHVCTSGARSGEHCSIVVQEVNQTVLGRSPMVVAELHEGCAIAKGDSGGAVYSYGTGGALARGIISAGKNGTAVCPNAPVDESSRFVAYAPLWRPAGDASIGALQFYRDAWIL